MDNKAITDKIDYITRIASEGKVAEVSKALDGIAALSDLPQDIIARLNPVVAACIEQDNADLVSQFYVRFSGFDVGGHLLQAISEQDSKPQVFSMLLETPDFRSLIANHGSKLDDLLRKIALHTSLESTTALRILLDRISHYNDNETQPDFMIPLSDIAKRLVKNIMLQGDVIEKLTKHQMADWGMICAEAPPSMAEKIFAQLTTRTAPGGKDPLSPIYAENLFAIVKDSLTQKNLSDGLEQSPDTSLAGSIKHAIRQKAQGKPAPKAASALATSGIARDVESKSTMIKGRVTVSEIVEAVKSGNMDQLTTRLISLESNQYRSGFQLMQVANAIIDCDNGPMMTYLYDRFPNLPIGGHLEKAGVIKRPGTSGTLRPAVAEAMLSHRDFNRLAKEENPVVSSAMNGLAIETRPESTRLLSQVIERFPQKQKLSGFLRSMVMDSLISDRQNCFTNGLDDNFHLVASHLEPSDCEQIIRTMVRNQSTTKPHTKSEKFSKRLTLLAQKIPSEKIDPFYIEALQHDNAQMIAVIAPLASGNTAEAELMACCSSPIIGSANKAPSLAKLETLLQKANFDEAVIFEAMGKAVVAKKTEHLLALINYARDENFDLNTLINQKRSDKNTLLTLALSLPYSKEVSEMADILVSSGADNRIDDHGRSPLSLMGPKFPASSSTRIALTRFLERRVDIATIAEEESARIRGRLQGIIEARKALEAAGIDDPEMLRLALGVSSPQAAPPTQEGHVRRLDVRRDDTTPNGPGGGSPGQ